MLLGRQRDPFANPVAHALSEGIHALLEGLLEQVGPEQLRAHMATAVTTGALPKYAVPERYLIVEEIPKTSVGKLDKKKIREIYA